VQIEEALDGHGLSRAPMQLPAGIVFPFRFRRILGRRALISGHGPQNPDGSIAQPLEGRTRLSWSKAMLALA